MLHISKNLFFSKCQCWTFTFEVRYILLAHLTPNMIPLIPIHWWLRIFFKTILLPLHHVSATTSACQFTAYNRHFWGNGTYLTTFNPLFWPLSSPYTSYFTIFHCLLGREAEKYHYIGMKKVRHKTRIFEPLLKASNN